MDVCSSAQAVRARVFRPQGHAYVDYDDEVLAIQLADAKCDAKKDPFRGQAKGDVWQAETLPTWSYLTGSCVGMPSFACTHPHAVSNHEFASEWQAFESNLALERKRSSGTVQLLKEECFRPMRRASRASQGLDPRSSYKGLLQLPCPF